MKLRLLCALLLGLAATGAPARGAAPAIVTGVEPKHLDAGYWTGRVRDRGEALSPAAIASLNERLFERDRSVRDLEALPATLDRATVSGWIAALSRRPDRPLFDEQGRAVPAATLDALMAGLDLGAVPARQPTRHGLVVRRADLRTFPTALRVFARRGETDIDRFQESALFPGTPVVIAHTSRDGAWSFVVSPLYAAWIESRHVAHGGAAQVFGYGRRTPYLVVTGATARTVFTREAPAVSELQLDMGVRVPRLPASIEPVNGQGAHAAYVIELPVRAADGSLAFARALLPRSADVARDYLPLTQPALLAQAFKFLGERYGWGHAYNARDCSGFVSEVYRSFGVTLPRNTGDQAASPVFDRIAFDERSTRAQRMAAVRGLRVGDLVYIPGHVMMVIGFDGDEPYVIHDTSGATFRDGRGALQRRALNGVSVTPLRPLLFNDHESYIDRMTSIQRIRPPAATGAAR